MGTLKITDMSMKAQNNLGVGITLIGGGYKYFTNAWIALRLLRLHGTGTPVQIWVLETEFKPEMIKWVAPYNAQIRVVNQKRTATNLPLGARWQWMLKPWVLQNCGFREVLLLDADSFPVRNPEYLFQCKAYKDTGALFWPDLPSSFRTGPENPIWGEMGIPFRHEREFESGQMVVNVEQHRDPLEFALEMNVQSEKYYQMLWGDKDTYRYAFHKFGRPFSMTPYPVEILEVPGGSSGQGVMCQHDFEGNRIFQHRNMAKWDLLAENARIPGFLFEEESREYLLELRRLWNGRVGSDRVFSPALSLMRQAERTRMQKEILLGVWLVEDRRPKQGGCCAPVQEWTEQRLKYPWMSADLKPDSKHPEKANGGGQPVDEKAKPQTAKEQSAILRTRER